MQVTGLIRRLAVLLLLLCPAAAHAASASLLQQLRSEAPRANPRMLELALAALACADPEALDADRRLAVIDYSLASDQPRMWVFDLARRELLYEELVAHGRGSGEQFAEHFSNVNGSHQSSLGLFRTAEPYQGRNGYSLRLQGLEPGVNDLAYDRAIVIHGADYVSPRFAQETGRIGRSHGCPAVSTTVAHALIDTLKNGHYLFSYYPQRDWLQHSAVLNCRQRLTGSELAANR